MSSLVQFIVLGLGTGAIYTLSAQGLVVVYKGSGVLNLAQGAVSMVGAFFYYQVGLEEQQWSAPVAMVVAVGASAAISAAIQIVLMRRLHRASPLIRLVATLGVFAFLFALGTKLWGTTAAVVDSPLPHKPVHLLSSRTAIGSDRLWLILVAVAVTVILDVGYRTTRFGRRTAAVAENPTVAGAVGFSPDIVAAVNWALAGALAAAAGILMAPLLQLHVITLSFVMLRALGAALIGRFESFGLTLAGAMGIGVTESLLQRFIENKGIFAPVTSDGPGGGALLFGLFTPGSVSRSAAFLVVIVVMVVRGRAIPLRSELLDRLPSLGTGRVRPWLVLPAFAAVAGAFLVVPRDWSVALTATLAWAIVLLSLVVVTGYVGQLSLAQVALAGVGAWTATQLMAGPGWTAAPAVAVAVATTVPIGVLIAVPALRLRGLNLAVLTFGFAVVVSELVLSNSALTGGLSGVQIGDIDLFGYSLNPIDHPDRWGIAVLTSFSVTALVVANIRRGSAGRQLIAVRDNEVAAASLGISVYQAKTFAFGVGAAIAGLGGALIAMRSSRVAYLDFTTFASVQAVVFVVIGGVGYIAGPLVGGALVAGALGTRLADSVGLGPLWFETLSGVLLLVMIVTHPDGLVDANLAIGRRLLRRLRRSPGPDRQGAPVEAAVERSEPRELVIDGLTVRFGGVVAVDDVSLTVSPGKVVGLIGPNGAGKTTVIDAITGLVSSSGGTVRFGGERIESWSPSRRARSGMARSFQSLELFEVLTVRDNLLAACDDRSLRSWVRQMFSVRSRQVELPQAAWAAVLEFDLVDDLDQYPGTLPYGKRRLVTIARAVASLPSVILLDEPVAGLNATESAELGRVIRRLADEWGMAVLLVEHDMDVVMSSCDRIVVLDFGQKIAEGAPAEVTVDPRVRAAYLGAFSEATQPLTVAEASKGVAGS